MATTYSAQTYTVRPNNQLPLYGASQEPSPVNSVSPTSPRTSEYLPHYNPNPAKQLRPLKSPLYVPAVLRPTEHFPTASPMTPPKSLHGSLEHLDKDGGYPTQTHLELYLEQEGGPDEELDSVTGPPTKDHWKPDEASPSCDSPQCRSNFNLFVRKHHCRHCGHIFCSSHANHTIPLDQSAKFHPDGFQSRACETCAREYQRWDTARSIRRKNSDNSSEDSGSQTPVAAAPPGHRRMISGLGRGGQRQQSVANSVPQDWAWSTF